MPNINKYERNQWNLAINLLGIGLIATVSPDLITRLSELKVFPQKSTDLLADCGALLVCLIILFCTVTVAFSSTKKHVKQIPWIFRNGFPMWTGVAFFMIYIAVIIIGGKSFINYSWPTLP